MNCEGASLVIRHNLYDALQALRSADETRVFWIDALCIDQGNHEERTQQVEMICEIYAASQGTMIWLGAKDAASSETIALLKKIANLTEANKIFNENESIWKGLGVLYRNPWFIGHGSFKKSLWLGALLLCLTRMSFGNGMCSHRLQGWHLIASKLGKRSLIRSALPGLTLLEHNTS